jgi:hypothetical protein
MNGVYNNHRGGEKSVKNLIRKTLREETTGGTQCEWEDNIKIITDTKYLHTEGEIQQQARVHGSQISSSTKGGNFRERQTRILDGMAKSREFTTSH